MKIAKPCIAPEIKISSKNHLIKALLRYQKSEDLHLIFFCRPNSNSLEIIGSYNRKALSKTPDLRNLKKGFLVAPFHSDTTKLNFYEADLHLVLKNFNENAELEVFLNRTNLEVESLNRKIDKKQTKKSDPKAKKITGSHYETIVEKAIKEIQTGTLKKVVIARKEIWQYEEEPDIAEIYSAMIDKYPSAFRTLLAPFDKAYWMGASPETLIQQNNNGIFRTLALAGTQSASNGDSEKEVLWSQKEIEEQALVSRYIVDCFKKLRLREFFEFGPRTVKAGNLYHLETDFEVDTIKTNFPELAGQMLELLHPTSAVCGSPKEKAMSFILENEDFDRELYSGFWGPTGFEYGHHLFVNLRCAKLEADQVALYAGAGITDASVPAKELKETQMKINTLGAIFENG